MGNTRVINMQEIFAGIFGTFFFICLVNSHDDVHCDVRAWTEAGWVCGLRRWSEYGQVYASFRGVPYAKQPIGELRFKELQPPEPWEYDYDAREEGPICLQHEELYGSLVVEEYGMTEACIHVNIHVPLHALPKIEKKYKNKNATTKNEKEEEKINDDSLPKDYENLNKENLDNVVNHQKYFEELLNILPKKYNDDKKDFEEEAKAVFEKYVKHGPLTRYQNDEKEPDNDFPKYQNERRKKHDNLFEWLDEASKINNDVRSIIRDGDEPRYFWPNNEKGIKYNEGKEKYTSEGVQFILDTWPKFEQEYKNARESISPTYRDKRHVYNDVENDEADKRKRDEEKNLLPILVFVHGGGFNAGSGDADLHGPEYLVSKDVIVVTFNYRIGLFGFLSLNTPNVPGNNGLRDAVTLLRWVQKNAKYFGGDPNNVTLMGQSAGAAIAHLLSLSEATKGLFKRVAVLSGTAYQAFYTTSPIYAAAVTASFLSIIGIISVDPEEIHRELIHMPIERIVEANSLLQAQYGLVTFSPVVETRFPGVTTVLDKEPEVLIAEGRGKEYPFIVGCTTNEGETFRRRFGYERYDSRIIANPRMFLPAGLIFSTPPNVSLALGERVKHRCFGNEPTELDGVVRCYGEGGFIYQAFRLGRQRAAMDSAPTYLYQFTYEGDLNLIEKGLKIEYKGTSHIEDLTYVFRTNSLLEPKSDFPPKDRDDMMRDWMSSFVINFMHCSNPTCHNKHKPGWPSVPKDHLIYEDIEIPYEFKVMKPTHKLQEMIDFFDNIYKLSSSTNATELTQLI